jgi:hypothetical protein
MDGFELLRGNCICDWDMNCVEALCRPIILESIIISIVT